MNWDFSSYGVGPHFAAAAAWVMPLIIWSLVWKGLALWVTARRGQNIWFVVFLVVNTAGIGEIIYLIATNGFKELNTKK